MERRKAAKASGCFCAQVRKAARIATQVYNDLLKPSGLTVTQFSVLSNINRNEDISVTSLAEVMITDQTTLTRNLKLLHDKSLIVIEPGEDRRIKKLSLTPWGVERLNTARPLWEEAQRHMKNELGTERYARLFNDLGEAINFRRAE